MSSRSVRKPVSRRRVRALVTLVGLAGLGLFLALVLAFTQFAPVSIKDSAPRAANTASNTATLDPEKIGLPVRLKIPKVNVDASVEQVGLTTDGAMDVPKGPANTAWYNLGRRPGQNGSAVIDGHFDLEGGQPGIFYNLHTLQIGDKVTVEDDKGVTITFTVRELRKYDPNADAKSVFISKDGGAHLNLITCAGVWNTAQQTYSNRLVVFTDKE